MVISCCRLWTLVAAALKVAQAVDRVVDSVEAAGSVMTLSLYLQGMAPLGGVPAAERSGTSRGSSEVAAVRNHRMVVASEFAAHD